MDFIADQFDEKMDKTVMEAKGEIESFCQNKINSIASAALVEQVKIRYSLGGNKVKIERHILIQEECELLYYKNNNNGNCACINMLHNPENGVECDAYVPEED